jgi:CubicO group peptidase (beta-lactamase class C family)
MTQARRAVDTIVQIGSITKPFTGAAIADLVRRGARTTTHDSKQLGDQDVAGRPDPWTCGG